MSQSVALLTTSLVSAFAALLVAYLPTAPRLRSKIERDIAICKTLNSDSRSRKLLEWHISERVTLLVAKEIHDRSWLGTFAGTPLVVAGTLAMINGMAQLIKFGADSDTAAWFVFAGVLLAVIGRLTGQIAEGRAAQRAEFKRR